MQLLSFFQSHASLSVAEWALRGLVGYVFLLVVARFMGQRSIGQLRLLDFVTALILGNILAHPLSDAKLNLLGPMITTVVVISLHVVGARLTLTSDVFRRFLEPPPVVVVRNGHLSAAGLRRARLSLDSLLSELRKAGVGDPSKVALALWEPGGAVSVFWQSPFAPATPSDLKLPTEPFTLPRPVIREGTVDPAALKELGKDLAWLTASLDPTLDLKDILLATVDDRGSLSVFTYRP
jgi:uncharacterized membrane protein YcaP (DUF421 family)